MFGKKLSMKKISLVAALTLFCAINAADVGASQRQEVVPADDSRITYVGRTLVQDGTVSFDWTAVYARISFTGNSLSFKASDTGKNYFNIWIDREPSAEPDKVIAVAGETQEISIVSNDDLSALYPKDKKARNGSHKVTIQRRTEGEQGRTTIHSYTVDGELTQAEGLKPRMIEFVGDSYTCGYGSENSISSDPFKPETENCSKTYASILARYFDADIICLAHSGEGIARNYDDGRKDYYMPDRYLTIFDEARQDPVKWDASKSAFSPAVTVIYLGTNDFSTSRQPSRTMFKRNYTRLLKAIKDNYGEDHPIVCTSSNADPILFEYIRETVEDCGMKNVTYTGFFKGVHFNNDTDLGASSHPNYNGHKKIAHALLPYIATATAWEMEDKLLK